MRARFGLLLTAVALLAAAAAGAQDFSAASPPGDGSAMVLIEQGLPAPDTRSSIETGVVRWFGLPELTTRALAIGGAWRPMRWATGVSRTGGDPIGWSSAALAIGAQAAGTGVALRACARRDAASGTGVEIGAGASSSLGEHGRLWASAPQLWTGGMAPPLERDLELGVALTRPGIEAWLVRQAAPRGTHGIEADHAVGVALEGGGFATWITLRDRPVRGAFGLSAGRAGVRVSAEIESHPVLPETVRLGLAWEGR